MKRLQYILTARSGWVECALTENRKFPLLELVVIQPHTMRGSFSNPMTVTQTQPASTSSSVKHDRNPSIPSNLPCPASSTY